MHRNAEIRIWNIGRAEETTTPYTESETTLVLLAQAAERVEEAVERVVEN